MSRLPDTINSYVKKPSKYKRKNKLSKQYPQLVDQQWATAHVTSVIINKDHPQAGGDNSMVNSILAIVHGDNLEANIGGEISAQVFKPLLNGFAPVPSVGEQVLVCQFAGVSYYLGPLNIENKVCSNNDNRYEEIAESGYSLYDYYDDLPDQGSYSYTDDYITTGTNPYFPPYCPKRVEKPYIHPGLDDTGAILDLDGVGHNLTLPQMDETEDWREFVKKPIPGDLLLEGRMGNYLRLGNRYKYPITVLSNRGDDGVMSDIYDTTVGSSILAMIDRGSINTNFGLGPGATNGRGSIHKFQTSNDIRTNGLIAEGNEAKYGFGDELYGYDYGDQEKTLSQALLRSGRITIDAKSDSIYLSSLLGVIIGGGEKVIVKSNKSIFLESELFVLGGNHESYLEDPDTNGDEFESMIFGDTFIEAFKSFLEGVKGMQVMTQLGPQDSKKIITGDGNLSQTITALEQELDKVLSKKHFK